MNHLTAYRSPIKLLSLSAEESAVFSEALIRQAKEKRFRLSPPDEETELALKQLSAATWPFHKFIFEQQGLLQFLEEGKFEEATMQQASFLRYNPAFVQFISGPFALAFQKASTTILQEKEIYSSLLKLMDSAAFLLPEHAATAFAVINQHLQQHIHTLVLLSWEEFVEDETQLDFVFSDSWVAFMNSLPVVCTAQRNEMIKMLLQLLKRFRLDASAAYLKAFCARLHALKMEPAEKQDLLDYQESFYLPRMAQEKSLKAGKLHWPLYLGAVALFLLVAGLLLENLGGKKKQRPEDRFMESVESVLPSDQRNSSVNERNLKGFFFLSARQVNNGKPKPLETGATPLPGMTKLPAGDGNSTLTVRNETASDALLFYFGSNNPLVSKRSRIVAVYIRRGEEYRCRFQPDFGRFNFLFGRQWVQMDKPVPFPIQTSKADERFSIGQQEPESWLIRDFFRTVSPQQPFLIHDLLITNIKQQTVSTSNNLVYTLLNEKDEKKRYSDEGFAEMVLQEKNGQFSVKARSSLFVYQSFPTFKPEDLR